MFKICPMCGHQWQNRAELLADENVLLVGYQVSFIKLEEGVFIFNHSCGTSFSLVASDFADLYNGPIFSSMLYESPECSEYCMNGENLEPCPVECECAYVREVIQIVKSWPKGTASVSGVSKDQYQKNSDIQSQTIR